MLALFTLLSQSFLFGPASPLSDPVCSGSIEFGMMERNLAFHTQGTVDIGGT